MPAVSPPEPRLLFQASPADPRAVVLVLPGGRAVGHSRCQQRQLSVQRVLLFARAIRRADPGLAVATLIYRYRGWNGEEASPLADARWALAELECDHPGADVVLVGHSMGGRVALRIADDPQVRGVVALAPWLPDGEPHAAVTGRRVLLVHGSRDRWTDPAATLRFAHDAAPDARSVRYVQIQGETHPMMRRPGLWHRLAVDGVAEILSGARHQSKAQAQTNRSGEPLVERMRLY